MFEKFNHRFRGNKHYDFFIVFAGALFGAFLILPEEWRRPAPLLLAAVTAALIAKFVSSNGRQRQDSD